MKATTMSRRLWALVALLLFLNVVLAGVARPLPRQDDLGTTHVSSPSSSPTASPTGEDEASTTASGTGSETAPSPSSTTQSPTGSATSSIVSATPFVSNGTDVQNATAPGELPLTPERSPGYYVAATVLMISGSILGAAAHWKHVIYCFFSVALSVSLGTTMIILLNINEGMSDGLQAGLVVSVVAAGSLAGGLAFLKPRACEPLGCLLAGFCFGMWILTLRESGLLGTDTTSNAIFLVALSLGPVVLYFFSLTRYYIMMAASAFSAATALILGIDFVSKAGLKEYWVWIWNLPNDNLFPPDAESYPLTMGIKVEQGVTIVFFLVALLIQWSKIKAIRGERAQQELESRAGQIAVQRADEQAGLDFARKLAPEKGAFEAKYSDSKSAYQGREPRADKFLALLQKKWRPVKNIVSKEVGATRDVEKAPGGADEAVGGIFENTGARQTSKGGEAEAALKPQGQTSVLVKHDSCVTEKTYLDSGITSGRTSTVPEAHMEESRSASPSESTAACLQNTEMNETGPTPSPESMAAVVMAQDEEAGRVTIHVAEDEVEPAAAAWAAQNPAPEVVPLPFKVPCSEHGDEVDKGDDDDHSSLAVAADEVYADVVVETGSKRSSFAKRLSTGSTELLRRVSQHSMSRHLARAAINDSESTRALNARHPGDRYSIAATFDDMSSVDGNDLPAAADPNTEQPSSTAVRAELTANPTVGTLDAPEKTSEDITSMTPEDGTTATRNMSTDPCSEEKGKSPTQEKSGDHKEVLDSDGEAGSGRGKSEVIEGPAVPLNLTTGKLETRVSTAAQTYRTVEWIKHSTQAEKPEVDNINIPELLRDLAPARPVDVEDLVKTAEYGAPRLAMPRTASAMLAKARTTPARHSHLSPRLEHDPSHNEQSRHAAIQATAAALAGGAVSPGSPAHSEAATAESLRSRPPVPGIKACNTPQSLLAKRETMVRMKEQALRPHSYRPAPITTLTQDLRGPPGDVPSPGSHPRSRRTSGTPQQSPNVSEQTLDDMDDADGIPMRQRQTLIREHRSSMTSMPTNSGNEATSGTESEGSSSRRTPFGFPFPPAGATSSLTVTNPNVPHAQRSSLSPSPAKRNSQLAAFRSSVQADMRASSQNLPVATPLQQPGYGGGYRFPPSGSLTPGGGGAPLINSVYNNIPGTSSSNMLLTQAWNAEVSRDLGMHRQSMMAQKGEDDARRQMRRAERQRQSLLRRQGAGRGEMLDAHAEMLLKLQRKATIE